jgi:predicted Zn-dependent protease
VKLVSSGLALLSLGLIGCQNPIKDPIDSIVQVVTNPQKEIQKGRQQYPIALAQSGGDLTQFPESTKYLSRLIDTLAKSANSAFPWEIRLINAESINAWALPGGKMGINYGLILAAQNEDELASVLGHEMAHSIELHGTGRETFGSLVGLATQILEISISEPGAKPGSNRLIGLGHNILMGQYSQSNELEADRIGVDIMIRAGFNPEGAIGMQEKLAKLGAGGNSLTQKILGTHPISRERLQAIRNIVKRHPNLSYDRVENTEFTKVKAEIEASAHILKMIAEARNQSSKKDFREALKILEKAIKASPFEHSFWRLKAEILVADRKPNQAVIAALKVRKLNPLDPISELLLAYCYQASGDKKNARIAKARAQQLMK